MTGPETPEERAELADRQRELVSVAPETERLLKSLRFVGERDIGFGDSERRLLETYGSLYSFLYDKIYYCWQNTCAQSMVAVAIAELLRSNKFDWRDLIRLTDVELFAALEDFENPLVQEIAYLVKYRRLYEYCYQVKFAGSLQLSEPALFDMMGGRREDRFKLLVAIRGGKTFKVKFAGPELMGGYSLGPEQIYGKASGRIVLFRVPGSRIDIASYIGRIKEILAGQGCSVETEEMSP
jgi:hypothetical protein